MTGAPLSFLDAIDNCGRTFQFNIGAHSLEFGDVHEPLWEDGFGDHTDAIDCGKQGTHLRLHIGGKSRVGASFQLERAARPV